MYVKFFYRAIATSPIKLFFFDGEIKKKKKEAYRSLWLLFKIPFVTFFSEYSTFIFLPLKKENVSSLLMAISLKT